MIWMIVPPVGQQYAVCLWAVRKFVDRQAKFQFVDLSGLPDGSTEPPTLPTGAQVLGPTTRLPALLRKHGLGGAVALRALQKELKSQDDETGWSRQLQDLLLQGPKRWEVADIDPLLQLIDTRYSQLEEAGRTAQPRKKSNSAQERFIASLPVAALILNFDGSIRVHNRKAASLLTGAEISLVGKTFGSLQAACVDYEDRELASVDRVIELATERRDSLEGLLFRVLQADGKQVHISAAVSPFLPAPGGTVVTLVDISRQVVIEKQLRNAEGHSRRMFEAMSYGIEEFDLDGIVTYGNPALHRMLGFEPGSLIGKPIWHTKTNPADAQALRDLLKALQSDRPMPETYYAENTTSDGRIVDLQVDWSYVYDEQGGLRSFIAVVTEVTERAQREASFRKMFRDLLAKSRQGFEVQTNSGMEASGGKDRKQSAVSNVSASS